MKEKGRVITSQRTTQGSRTLEPKIEYKNYLEELRKDQKGQYIDYAEKPKKVDYSRLLKNEVDFNNKLNKLETENRRKEKYVRNI